jgi:metal-sulfur cluster biosynthetic enzyme
MNSIKENLKDIFVSLDYCSLPTDRCLWYVMSCMAWVLLTLSVTHVEAVWNESWTPSYLSRMGKLCGMSPGPHLICHAWESCMEWVLDPILSVRHGKAVWNESWTPSYLSRMGKLYGMSPVNRYRYLEIHYVCICCYCVI